ncbi:MAG: SpvB/TcaC N-terminal domain-containing protein, partial [Steroidobacteraceae bacterium]
MAKRLCGSVLSSWSLLAISAWWLCVLSTTPVEAAVGRTSGNFNVSANGAATYTIPIFTPPGPKGVQPSIALSYNSNSDVGNLGRGWSLAGFSAIRRCNKTVAQDGVARNIVLGTDDAYCVDGNRLRLQSGTYGADSSWYYTEMADFSRITANGSAGYGPQSWTVERKDGLIYTYGGTAGSRAAVTSGYYANTVMQWFVSEIRDRAGNKVKFTWKAADSTTVGTTHPVKIEWTQTSAGSGSYVYSMDFSYTAGGNAAASTPYGFVNAFNVTETDLLTSIAVSDSGTVKRKYVLTYESSPTSGAKRLTQVKECSDGAAADCLSPTAITYQDNAAGVNTSSPIYVGPDGIGNYDFNGDGILDLLGDGMQVRFGSVSSGYSSPVTTGGAPGFIGKLLGNRADQLLSGEEDGYWYVYAWNGSSFTSTNTGISWLGSTGLSGQFVVADVDGDGLDDLVSVTGLQLTVRRNTSTGGSLSFASPIHLEMDMSSYSSPHWNQPSGWALAYNLDGASLLKGGDKNGDGRQVLTLYLSFVWGSWPDDPYTEPNGGYYTETRLVEFSGSGSSIAATFTLPSPYLETYQTDADFNGDGCDDSIYYGYGYTGAWLSGCGVGVMGDISQGSWGGSVATTDWNGDGNADIIVYDGYDDNFWVQLIQGGQITLLNSGIPHSNGWILRTDANGDGLDDLGFIDSYSGLTTIYPHNGTSLAPDMLASIVDGFGVTHTPTYTRIERSNYSAYNDAVYPARDVTRGRYVVKKVTATDGIGGTFDTDYNYFGAQVNLQGRGFAGFEKIQSVDSRNGVMREQKFKREFPYNGMPYEVNDYQSSSGPLMSKRTTTAASDTLDATTYNKRYFIYLSATAEEAYEVGGAKNGELIQQSSTSNTYDSWGNLTASTSTVTDKDTGSPLYNQTWTAATSLTISPNTTYWCLGLPSASTITQSSSVSGETTVYQSKGFSPNYQDCRNDAESVGSGALQVDTGYGFDAFGNVNSVSVTGRNPNSSSMTARTASISWGTTGQFPVSETNALSQTTTRTYDSTFGSLLTEHDPNSIAVADNTYDTFGRLTRSIRADGTATRMTYAACATYGCENGDPASGATGINKTIVVASERNSSDAQVRDSWTYLDQFDRPIVHKAMNAAGGYSRSGTQYDALHRTYRQTAPCDASSCTAYWVTNTYDLAGRVATQSRPQSQSVSTPVTTTFGYAGRTQTVTDPQSKVTTKILDVKGQMRRSQDHNGYYQNFAYDAAGSLLQVTDQLSNTLFTASYSYGIKPFQTVTTDMDLGTWSYSYNSLGELVSWTDAKSQTFSQTYDALSRVTTRTEAEGTTVFVWGATAGAYNIGRLQDVSTPGGAFVETFAYDSAGRLATRYTTSDQSYRIDFAYNSQGLLDTLTYPASTSSTRVAVKHGYAYGILNTVTDWTTGSAGTVYWTANTQNARGQTTQETLGNGVVTNRSFDAVTGLMSSIQSAVGGGTTLQNQSYLYDLIGNVTQRQENTQGLTENFYYDNLYRLDYSQLNSTTNLDLSYDAMGNITSKSDVNGGATWTYNSTKKHAVATTGSGGTSYSY